MWKPRRPGYGRNQTRTPPSLCLSRRLMGSTRTTVLNSSTHGSLSVRHLHRPWMMLMMRPQESCWPSWWLLAPRGQDTSSSSTPRTWPRSPGRRWSAPFRSPSTGCTNLDVLFPRCHAGVAEQGQQAARAGVRVVLLEQNKSPLKSVTWSGLFDTFRDNGHTFCATGAGAINYKEMWPCVFFREGKIKSANCKKKKNVVTFVMCWQSSSSTLTFTFYDKKKKSWNYRLMTAACPLLWSLSEWANKELNWQNILKTSESRQ